MHERDYYSSMEESSVIEFIKKFSGEFGTSIPSGIVHYMDDNKKSYRVPETKAEFLDLINESIKQNKNLFLGTPINHDGLKGMLV